MTLQLIDPTLYTEFASADNILNSFLIFSQKMGFTSTYERITKCDVGLLRNRNKTSLNFVSDTKGPHDTVQIYKEMSTIGDQ